MSNNSNVTGSKLLFFLSSLFHLSFSSFSPDHGIDGYPKTMADFKGKLLIKFNLGRYKCIVME